MTIDDRLTRAGQRFRDGNTEPANVHLATADTRRPGRASRPRRRRLVGIAVAAVAVVALTVGVLAWVGTSGGSPRPAATTPAPAVTAPTLPSDPLVALTTVTWELTDVDTGTAPVLHPAIQYTLTVATDAQGQELHLDDDCNVYSLPVGIGADAITVTGQGLSTAVGCNRPDDPAVTALAPVFGADSIAWSISGMDLTLTAAGVTLTLAPVTPTAPTSIGHVRTFWQLVGVVENGSIVPVTSVRSTGLVFDSTPGHVVVLDGCNSLDGAYSLDGSTLMFSGFGSTQVACAGDSIQWAIEQVFSEGATEAQQTKGRLTLTRGSVVLTYDSTGAG